MDLGSGGSWLATRRPSARRVISKGWLTPPTWRKCICEQPPRPAIPNMRAPLNAQDPVRRMAAVLVTSAVRAAAPPGVDPGEFGLALVEDSCDLVAELELVAPAVAVSHEAEHELGRRAVEECAWPGTAVLRLAPAARAGLGLVGQTLRSPAALGPGQGGVLAADAPGRPPPLV